MTFFLKESPTKWLKIIVFSNNAFEQLFRNLTLQLYPSLQFFPIVRDTLKPKNAGLRD